MTVVTPQSHSRVPRISTILNEICLYPANGWSLGVLFPDWDRHVYHVANAVQTGSHTAKRLVD